MTISTARSLLVQAGARLSRRERAFVLGGLGGLSGIAWGKLVILAGKAQAVTGVAGAMSGLVVLSGPGVVAPTELAAPHLLTMIETCAVALVAVMLPTATPLVLGAAALCKQRWPREEVLPRVMAFVAGHVLVWLMLALTYGLLAWELESLRPEIAARETLGPILGGAVLVLAGLYQFTPIKQACLAICQAPGPVLIGWRGPRLVDALRAGLLLGRISLKSDWALALLLFVGGLGNPVWIAALAFFAITEKLFSPEGDFGRWAGLMMALGGMAVLFGTTF